MQAPPTSNAHVWYWLQLVYTSPIVFDWCLAEKPAEKPTGLSQDAAPSSAGRFSGNARVLIWLCQIWLAERLWSQHLAGSNREGTQSFHVSLPSPILCPNTLLTLILSTCRLSHVILQSQLSGSYLSGCNRWITTNEWLGLAGPSVSLVFVSLHVGLAKAIAYYIQQGHVWGNVFQEQPWTIFKGSMTCGSPKFKRWKLLLVRWVKIFCSPLQAGAHFTGSVEGTATQPVLYIPNQPSIKEQHQRENKRRTS